MQTKLEALEAKVSPELIKYDYEEIKQRIDPIRDELMIASRIFDRILRSREKLPIAVAVSK